MMVDPKNVAVATNLIGKDWLFRGQTLELENEEFSKLDFGVNLKTEDSFNNIRFVSCKFNACTWTKISHEHRRTSLKNCVFEKNVFNDTRLRKLEKCTFAKASGELFNLEWIENCKLSNCQFGDAQLSGLRNTDVVNCKFKKLRLSGYFDADRKCSFSGITANEVDFEDAFFESVVMKDIKLSNIQAAEACIQFENCKLTNVTFKNAKFKELSFEDCQLTDCVFDNVEGYLMDLKKSKVSKCKYVNSVFIGMHINEKQQKSFAGVDRSHLESSILECKYLMPLAKNLDQAAKVKFSFEGPMDGGDLVTVSGNFDYSYEVGFNAKKDKQHSASSRPKAWMSSDDIEISDIIGDLVWAFQAAKFTDVDLGSIKLKTSKCRLKPKDMKRLIFLSAYEAIGKEAKAEAELEAAKAK